MAAVNFAGAASAAAGRATLVQLQAAEVAQRNAIIAASTAPAPGNGISPLVLVAAVFLAFHFLTK